MKRLLTLFTLILSSILVMGQELTVKNFALAPRDLTASTQPRNDANGHACALIKVQLARPGAEFLGNVMGDTPYNKSVYMVYMMKGSKMLEVRLDGYLPVMIDFEKDWGIKGVESLTTYVLSITLPNVVGLSVDDGKTYFILNVEPRNATVFLDGDNNPISLDENGSMMRRLSPGKHSYRVIAGGYETKTEEFVLGRDRMSRQVKLESSKAKLTVKCSTSGADIYINEKKFGSSPSWTGSFDPGSYIIEARKEGHYTQQQNIELSPKQNLTVELPALIALVGQLDVAYSPMDAEVWIDGKKAGLSPDVIKNLTIGSHRVDIRKEGYQSETKTVTIAEGQTATLNGSLTALTSSSSTLTASATSTTGTTTSSSSSQDKQTFTVNGVSFTMVRVKGGTFTMGATSEQGSDVDDDEKPAHQVTLSTYSIGETEVTQELWQAVMGGNPSNFKGNKRPVEKVSWNDCQDFINKLNAATGRKFRLPTEAEWEYAARGGNSSRGYKYSGSNIRLEAVAWYDENSGGKTHDVATKQPNELWLYDMSGNVYEWCSDRYGSYTNSSQTNPQVNWSEQRPVRRVCRGGCWINGARSCRSSYRFGYVPNGRGSSLGLRLALSE